MPEAFITYRNGGIQGITRTYTTACCGYVALGEGSGGLGTVRVGVPSDPVEFALSHFDGTGGSVYIDVSVHSLPLPSSADSCTDDYAAGLIQSGSELVTQLNASNVLSSNYFPYTSSGNGNGNRNSLPSLTNTLTNTLSATLSSIGCFSLTFTVLGPGKDDYAGSEGSLTVAVPVIDLGAEPAPPTMQGVRFTGTGAGLSVTMSGPFSVVDSDGSGTGGFDCGLVFNVTSSIPIPSVGSAPIQAEGMCTITSPTTLHIPLPSTSTLLPLTSTLTLLPSTLRPFCDPLLYTCSSWSSSSPSLSLGILPPVSPLVPVPVLTGPSSLGRCAPLSIDGATSGGAGGRSFTTVTISLISATKLLGSETENENDNELLGNLTRAVDSWNAANALAASPALSLSVPVGSFPPGYRYIFSLTLCNFLGSCASTSSSTLTSNPPLTIVVSSGSLPTLVILGPSPRTLVSTSNSFAAQALGTPATCPGSTPSPIPSSSYSWTLGQILHTFPNGTVLTSGALSPPATSTSIDRTFFKLPGGTLTPGLTYYLEVTVIDSTGLSNTASQTLIVLPGSLVPILSGGGRVAEASEAASTVVLDAGGSYDEDSPEATLEEKVAAGFTWEWECAEKTPGTGYGSYCGGYCGGSDSFGSDSLGSDSFGVGEELKSSSGSRISLAPSDLASLLGGSASSRSFEFLVVISDSGSRTVSSRTILVVSPESLPSISIQPMGRLKINPSKKLRIQGGVVRPGAGQGVVSTWEETTGRMGSLAEVIGSNGGVGVGRTVEGGGEEGTLVPLPIIIPSGTLQGGVSYTFRLSGFYSTSPSSSSPSSSSSSYAEITVLVNSPPSGGGLVVLADNGQSESSSGISLLTEFKVQGGGFIDDAEDYPLTYSFFYRVGSHTPSSMLDTSSSSIDNNKLFTIASQTLSPSILSVLLPSGSGQNSTVTVFAVSSDVHSALSLPVSTHASVTLPPYTLAELGEATASLTESALETGELQKVFQVLAGAATILNSLNSLNCSRIEVGECGLRSREECGEGTMEQSCGKCLGGYVEDSEDTSGVCQPVAPSCTNGLKDGSETDVDCGGGGGCEMCGVGGRCARSEDCEGRSECTEEMEEGEEGEEGGGVCDHPPKECPGGCGGTDADGTTNTNGECLSYDYNGLSISSRKCLTSSIFCSVRCSCSPGHFGSSCLKSSEEFTAAKTQRKNMLETLGKVRLLQDIDTESTRQQASGMRTLLENVEELDKEGREIGIRLLSGVTKGGLRPEVRISEGTGRSLAEAVSSLMEDVTDVTDDSSSDSDSNNGGETKVAEFRNISHIISNLINSQIQGQFAGEGGVTLVTNNLKMVSQKLTVDDLSNKEFTFAESDGPVIVLPDGDLGEIFDDGCNVGVSFAELGSHKRADNTSLDTAVSRFGMGCYYEEGETGRRKRRRRMEDSMPVPTSKITVVLQMIESVKEERRLLVEPTIVSVTCDWDEFHNITTICPDTPNLAHVTKCNGVKNVTSITCPAAGSGEKYSCSTSQGDSWSDENCVVVDHTDTNITCECDVFGLMESKLKPAGDGDGDRRRRRLNTIYDDQDSAEIGNTEDIDFVGLTEGIMGNFAATWKLTATLTPAVVLKNFVIFASMGSILVLGFLFCVRGVVKDKQERKRFIADKEIEFLSRYSMTMEDKFAYIIDKSTPSFIQYMDNTIMNIKTQLGKRHDFFSMYYMYSPMKSRAQRVSLLVCTLLGMMFGESVLFDLAYPDYEPGCASYEKKVDCELIKSFFNATANNCLWTPESQSCSFIEPTASMVNTMGIAVLACIISSPLGVIMVIIFNETIFPPVRGGTRAEAIQAEKEQNWKSEPRGIADLTWNVYSDEDSGSAGGDYAKANVESPSNKKDSESGERISEGAGLGKEFARMKYKNESSLACFQCCKKSPFDIRVEQEVGKTITAIEFRKVELESTVHGLERAVARNKFDEEARVNLKLAKQRLSVFNGNWLDDRNLFTNLCGLKASNSKKQLKKIKGKVRYDLKLADAIEHEFKDLDKDTREVRLLEYARMMKLSKVERNIYFQNRLTFETEMVPVTKMKKIAGWAAIVLYSVGTAYYICLFGVSKGAETTNMWLTAFVLATLQDVLLYMPLKILFLNVYLPSLISRRLNSISNPRDAESFHFSSFMPDSAAVHVAMNHPELDAAKLVLSRDSKEREGNKYLGEREVEEGANSPMHGRRGGGLDRSATQKNLMKKVSKSKEYYNKGCNKFGLTLFAVFLLMPEFVQLSILDVVIPTAIGSFVYGNYQLYKIREWSPYTLNLGLVVFVCGTIWYFRYRRAKHHIAKKQTGHVNKFRNSVLVELSDLKQGKEKEQEENCEPEGENGIQLQEIVLHRSEQGGQFL